MKQLVILESEQLTRQQKVERLEAAGFDLRQAYECERVEVDGVPARRYTQEAPGV